MGTTWPEENLRVAIKVNEIGNKMCYFAQVLNMEAISVLSQKQQSKAVSNRQQYTKTFHGPLRYIGFSAPYYRSEMHGWCT